MREKIFLDGKKNIHFIGIGGISMSGLAEILHRDGFNVSGSDDVETEITRHLARLGIKISVPNAAKNILDEHELVVFTAAVKKENPEFVAASQKQIELIERAAFIGKILKGYDPICVAGSHGKTTTTSMISEILIASGHDPTVSVGGIMNSVGVNYRIGSTKNFVLEACEYSNSFHHWQPLIGVILNIDADHLDFFGSMDNLILSFEKFASNIRPDGALIVNENVEINPRCEKCEKISFGIKNSARFHAKNIFYDEGKPSFDVFDGENFLAHVDLPLPGEYNLLNALAAFAATTQMKIPPQIIAGALNNARGTKRRFEHKGEFDGIKIIDDYAHHPTEIVACLKAARQSASGRIFCLFQPHTYTRTKNLLHDFAKSFCDADFVILLPIYAAREPNDPTVSSEILAAQIKNYICEVEKNSQNKNPRLENELSYTKKNECSNVKFVKSFDEACNFLNDTLVSGDLLITMGAGDVFKVGDEILRKKLST
ncbi:MAG: UDP-N-acetylmuramate--L-alanine ligase [Defluviitaleaceae bacterium]|nr:UDP-N-acetylmuramate--L-alanine ligase [Defluviitaleaceae bacterium]